MRNYHTHTFRCKHAQGEAIDYAKAAVEKGFTVLGITDHTPLPDNRWLNMRMAYSELPAYVAAVRQAQRLYPQLKILLGMECEWLPEYHHFLEEELLGRYQLDYLILGSHYFPYKGKYLSSHLHVSTAKQLSAYTRHLISAMETGLFAFVAHPDLFGLTYLEWDANTEAASRDILIAAQELGLPLEINGYGLLNKVVHSKQGRRVAYPWLPFCELAAAYQVRVLVNSDAHSPQDLDQGLLEGAQLIKTLGLTPVASNFLLRR